MTSQKNWSLRVTWIKIYTFLQEAAVKRYFQIVIKMSLPPTTVSVLRAQRSSERAPREEWREFLPSSGFFYGYYYYDRREMERLASVILQPCSCVRLVLMLPSGWSHTSK